MNENNFVGYEYKDVTTKREMESVYVDGYRNFGWQMETSSVPEHSLGTVAIKFKRDRKILNKAELTRLQRQFESCAGEIESLERSKTTGASITAFTIGIIGTAFMGLSTFSYLGGMLPLMIILAVPGFIGWIIPYFCYHAIQRTKANKLVPIIEKKYDDIYAVCEKANSLLAG